jgi:hypothetical protein
MLGRSKLFSGLRRIRNIVSGCFSLNSSLKEKKTEVYISCRDTVDAAQKKGLSISDYVEDLWNQTGLTDQVMNRIGEYCGNQRFTTICEIGPGTGRYMFRALDHNFSGRKEDYHFYEVAEDWADWLEETYRTRRCISSGDSLIDTRDCWSEFTHAHGVFVYTPLIVTCKYLYEMGRISSDGGLIAFDIYSEDCFTEKYMKKWIASGERYPVLMSVQLCDQIMSECLCQRIGDFFSPHGAGLSHYLIYSRTAKL